MYVKVSLYQISMYWIDALFQIKEELLDNYLSKECSVIKKYK